MFYAIDKKTNNYVLAINIKENNYKDSYNYKLRYICADSNCNDSNVSFINGLKITPHFRHSINSINCNIFKEFKEYNTDFYNNWFKLFKYKYRKPYWFNAKLEEISNNDTTIIIKYSFQKPETIKSIESYAKNKIIWILSLKKRNYSSIFHDEGKIYIDFTGNKNDIPLYNSEKSIVYLDTGTDILLKILLDSYTNNGQEIEIVNIYDFCNNNNSLLDAYPYRIKNNIYNEIIYERNNYINNLLYDDYKKYLNIQIKQERELNNYYYIIDERNTYINNILYDDYKKYLNIQIKQERELNNYYYIIDKRNSLITEELLVSHYNKNRVIKEYFYYDNELYLNNNENIAIVRNKYKDFNFIPLNIKKILE